MAFPATPLTHPDQGGRGKRSVIMHPAVLAKKLMTDWRLPFLAR